MAEKLSDKLKKLFSKTRNAPGKGAYPAKFEQRAFKAGQKTTAMMKNIASKSLFKKGTVGKPSNVAKSLSKELITASAAKKLKTASKVAKLARVATPLGLGTVAAQAVYDVATMSPEKKAKVKKLKTKLSKKSTKDYHADLLKNSAKTGKMMKASLGLLAMRKAKKKGAKGAELLSPAAMATRFFNKGGDTMLKGNQAKLDKNKDGKISGEDFKMMKAYKGAEAKGYGAARTQGEGLQDENLIPGKSLDYYKDIM